MGKHRIRRNKTCLNCGHYVEKKFCPNCGQENTESSVSFHYLFKHFFEDLIHYDSSFWETIKYLLFSPNKLTQEYLSGKRKTYVEPVKLYIFISFAAFLIPSLLPDTHQSEESKGITINISLDLSEDSIESRIEKCTTVAQLDSLQESLPHDKKMSFIQYQLEKRSLKFKNKDWDWGKSLKEAFIHNLPKVLFFYMPIFAFLLWLFHNKKRWLFYHSGIFTLHYFSFLLFSVTIYFILEYFLFFGSGGFFSLLRKIITFIFIAYLLVYFFIAHKRMYEESYWVSNLKSAALTLINFLLIIITLIGYTLLTLMIIL